jgi:transcriptional regulator with XRE-family HTH domain
LFVSFASRQSLVAMPHRINLSLLAKLLKHARRKTGLSLNKVSLATGISRRTLARIESGFYEARGTKHGAREPRLSPRTTVRLLKLMLTPEHFDSILSDATRLSRSLGDDPLYRYLDVLYDYPAVLFHRSAAKTLSEVEGPRRLQQLARDFRNTFPLLLRSGFGARNLGRRLRAFRLQNDLNLVETAALLDISKSQLHRIESGQRHPSPRLRFRLLRLLTLPLLDPSSGHDFSRAGRRAVRRSLGRGAGKTSPGLPAPESPVASRQSRVAFFKALLSLPPPTPPEFSNDPDGLHRGSLSRVSKRETRDLLHRLQFHWLTSSTPTKSLAAQLGIGQPHLIRLLRDDRKPSRKLRDRIARLVG